MKVNISIISLAMVLLLPLSTALAQNAQRLPSSSGSLAADNSLQDEARRLQEAEERLLQKLAAGPETAVKAEPALVPVKEEAPAAPREAPKTLKLPDPMEEPAKESASISTPEPAEANLQDKAREQASQIFRLQKSNMEMTGQVRSKDQKIQELKRQLSETRNRLIVAETEVERLARSKDNCNASYVASYGAKQAPRLTAPQPAAPAQNPTRARAVAAPARVAAAPAAPAEPDLPVAIVKVDKAALRAGPGPENSQLMAVSKGTRLTVETRSGSWYRVNTPTGTRAWISADVVSFASAPAGQRTSLAPSALKVGAYDASAEKKAFELSGTSAD